MKFFSFFNPTPVEERVVDFEYPDPTPIAKPAHFNRPGSTLDQIRANLDQRMALLNREMQEAGHETIEESQDFDVGEDDEPITIHELRAHAASLDPVALYEHVFKKQYVPPAPPVDPRTPASGLPGGPDGNAPYVAGKTESPPQKQG